jgi:hypothetical protein
MTIHKIEMPNKPLSTELFAEKNPGCQLFTIENDLFISGVNSLAEAKAALDAHNPPAPIEPTVAEKLASVGLSVADLKTALGL